MDGLRADLKTTCQVINLLVEGVGIRAISRLTGLHQQTILNIVELAGQKAASILDREVRSVKAESIQIDELFCFVNCKERKNITKDREIGEQYVFLSIDSKSKLIINHAVGKRDMLTAHVLLSDLQKRLNGVHQITTDGFSPYLRAMLGTFYNQVHFAQMIKIYANRLDNVPAERRYSPSPCIGTKVRVHIGDPDPAKISTSYVERTNLSVRLFNRRFTRLTLGYSKKIVNLKHSVALFQWHFNYVRIHSAHKQTPAQAANLTDHRWTIEELLTYDIQQQTTVA